MRHTNIYRVRQFANKLVAPFKFFLTMKEIPIKKKEEKKK